ncbi:beta-ketoacyl-ACP synthase III [Porphyromonas circumdentaria]|uniref:Beta-ketoacyl-[acyl-carrier-protein] synthase III n=1 Tax=Porphyromonas circumdentaria TaxID=29524 RepID=A0A1T4M4V0_9PORP|nr:beta-ketoacyl-ACP synthase III [Porphyromonas circumdentaria]MBB6275577.1 3-oxoacyl-[acyl-carrier-protein] synthase-3 [Porphyromonas circumdentaria]SJZ61876.1 3-oxoacyl-[acyl-carrier-protein] synthase III [Porphyromonas circumdentaria]
MNPINATITAVGAYLPEDKLTNSDLEKIVETSDEWIMTRVGIKERRILKQPNLGASYLATQAVKGMFEHYQIDPLTVEAVILATNTADYHFPSTSSIVAFETGCSNAFTFDINSACPSWLYALETAANYIRSGRYKKIVVVATEKMSAAIDYTDRQTCVLFGDGSGCALVEATEKPYGVMDALFRTDGVGKEHLIMKSGGSASPASKETVERREHFVYQEGTHVFKYAVTGMADACRTVMKRNNLTQEDITWVVPHQANLRIIDMVGRTLKVPHEKVMINIEKYGNTSSATIPICLWEWEKKLRKGDNLILTSFGAGYTWGAVYLKWGYDPK